MLHDFRNHILDKIVTLQSIKPQWDDDQAVVDAQAVAYRNIIGEIDSYIEGLQDDENDKFSYLMDEDGDI